MLDLEGYGWMLWAGVLLTLLVGVGAMAVAVALGLLGAWGKLGGSPVAAACAHAYTTVVRGVPELLLILLVYYGVPTLVQDLLAGAGHRVVIDLDPFLAGTLTIGFIYGAFATEVFRGACLAVPRGQIEAARVAMTRFVKRGGKIWVRVFPDKPITKKPQETRMGKGKGAPEQWVAVVRPGRILFEMEGVSAADAKRAMELAAAKLPIDARFTTRFGEAEV